MSGSFQRQHHASSSPMTDSSRNTSAGAGSVLLQSIAADAVNWRRHLHMHPEIGFDVPDTARFIAERLHSFGLDQVDVDVGGGVVGVLEGKQGARYGTLALRAEMDALPILELNRFDHASRNVGRMHACGHDGHMAMLLAAAAFLSKHREGVGRIAFVFQPAEEGDAGARAMLEHGLVERYGITRAIALHNRPGIHDGALALLPGPVMAAADRITFLINASGGHAAMPHLTADPVVVGASIIIGCQLIVSRHVSPLQPAVLTIPVFEAGTVRNVIPPRVRLHGTLRTVNQSVRRTVHEKLRQLANAQAASHDADVQVEIEEGYPAVVNNAETVAELSRIAEQSGFRIEPADPMMASDDFAYIADAVPSAYAFIGNGKSAGLHEPTYDFNDAVLLKGALFWIETSTQFQVELGSRTSPRLACPPTNPNKHL
jgi:amidohydrolase